MQYLRLSIKTTGEAADMLCAELAAIGVIGFEIEDKADMLVFFREHTEVYDYIDEELLSAKDNGVFVKVYLETDDTNLLNNIYACLDGLDKSVYGELSTSTATLSDTDWNEEWKKYFHVTPVGERLLIVPEWESVKDTGGRTVFRVDPGQVFGTGTHDSTRLCMELAEKYVNEGDSVLDLGCGTGILGITARLLGAKSAVYADINPDASAAVQKNCELNGVFEKPNVVIGNILCDNSVKDALGGGYDVVFANIVSDVIIAAAADLRKYGKTLITSGIIDTRAEKVEAALHSAGFKTVEKRTSRGWVAFSMK